jgi:amidase
LKHDELYEAAVSSRFFCLVLLQLSSLQNSIWGAGLVEDVRATTAASGEPIITSMSLDPDAPNHNPPFTPSYQGASVYDLWQLHKKKRELRKDYLDHWQATISLTGTGRPVDAIISPVAPLTPSPHGANK